MATHTALGEIVKAQPTERGFTKMILLVNIPYKTIYTTFNLWSNNVKKYFTGSDKLKVGDCVLAKYHYKGNFTELDDMTKMENFDNCPICWCNLEAMNAQRIDCPGCSIIDEDEAKIRVNTEMTLTAKEVNQYRYSSGYKLTFSSKEDGKEYVFVVFQKSPLFEKMDELIVLKNYSVVGWQTKGDFKIHPLDVVNIFKN